MNANQLVTLILAGGQSSRMGRDKALVEWDGVPLLRRVYDVASTCSDRVCIVTPRIETYRQILPESCHWLEETAPGGGPMDAFYQGWQQIDSEWVLLLGCDLPRLDVNILGNWAQQLDELSPEVLAFVPHHVLGWEPLCGFYKQEAKDSLKAFMQTGGRSFQKWLPTIPIRSPVVDDRVAEMLRNVNSPADL